MFRATLYYIITLCSLVAIYHMINEQVLFVFVTIANALVSSYITTRLNDSKTHLFIEIYCAIIVHLFINLVLFFVSCRFVPYYTDGMVDGYYTICITLLGLWITALRIGNV